MMPVFLLLACANQGDTAEMAMPIEVVSCTHPDSRFEAAVHVEVEDSVTWSDVHFSISQGESEWETKLQTEDQLLWWTRMQLYELDCLSEFDFGVEYEAR